MGTSRLEPGVTISEAQGGSVTGVATSVAAFVGYSLQGPVNEPRQILSWSGYEALFGGIDSGEMGYAVASFYDNGGGEAWVVRVPGAASDDGLALIGDASVKTGLHALEGVDLFNLLCLPDLRRLTGGAHLAAGVAAAAYCRGRRAFLILDLPAGIDAVEAAKDWATSAAPQLGSENTSYAAAYWPEPLVADPLDSETPRQIAASGIMAGLYATTDRERGVWSAPAGISPSMAGVIKLAFPLTDADTGLINPLGLNALRTFPAHGTVAWGVHTLQGSDALASDWKYVPVRRLDLFIEQSLVRGLAWTVFEPGGERLWASIQFHAGPFLNDLWRQGALSGASPNQAYFLKCDSTTTSAADIETGIANLIVGFAPVKPAEFVVLEIQLRTATS